MRARNPHRNTEVWETTAVRAILQNPRYTGRQVWNRVRTDEVLLDVEDIALGHENRRRWNHPSEWIWSKIEAHPPLISTDLYERAQQTVKARGTAGEAGKAPRRSGNPYLFRGLLRCGVCERRMAGSVNHGRIYYRCKAPRDYVRQHGIAHPPVLYVRKDAIANPVDQFLTEELGGGRLAGTLRQIAEAATGQPSPSIRRTTRRRSCGRRSRTATPRSSDIGPRPTPGEPPSSSLAGSPRRRR
ncbi:recombinase family protein [Actinoplanes sp. NPDC049265]|uniref:recombinase family protein n=1 Tax=Actinoplanes sp. NPDC049265 TaxID=3363902 RepID=UPI00371C0515